MVSIINSIFFNNLNCTIDVCGKYQIGIVLLLHFFLNFVLIYNVACIIVLYSTGNNYGCLIG